MKRDASISAQPGDTANDASHDADSLALNTVEALSSDLRKHDAWRLAAPSQIGDYEVLSEIARGGMGVVYKARQQSLGRIVALKMILDSKLVSEQQVKRFRGEAEAAARLDHSGIVPVYEVGEADGRHFFSMALVEGGSLQKLIARGPIAPQAAAKMVAQIAQAVEYAHQQGVVHRDLKPQNILLDKQGQPKVSDFGLARRLDSTDGLTASGDVVGTPGYMAPEQALGRVHEVGPLADVYALGAILYCLLTGRPPFQAAALAETLRQINEQEAVSPRLLNAATPLDLETICLKALQKDPGRRYASAQALADDLQRFIRGESILARPISTWERAWRFCRRKPAWAGLIGALAAMAIAGVALVVVIAQLRVASANATAQEAQLEKLKAQAKASDAELQAQRQVADTQKYYALLAQIRQNAAARKPGWTWINQQQLTEAAALDTAAMDEFEVRSQAAETLGAFDLREVATDDTNFHVSAVACAPNGQRLVLAQLKDWLACVVQVRSLPGGKVLHKLRFASSALYQAKARRQDGTASLAVSSDSRWIAVGTRSGMVHLWDLQAPKIEPRSWQCDDSGTNGLRFHPDGQRLFSCSSTGVLRSWSLDTLKGTELATNLGNWSTMPISPDGKIVAGYRSLYLVDDFTQVAELEESARLAVFHPGGRLLAQAGGGDLQLVDVSTGRICRRFVDPEHGQAHEGGIGALAFHPQGNLLASCSNQRLKLWEVASGALLASVLIGPAEETRLVFTVDGRYLIVTAQRKLLTYELGGMTTQSFLAHEPLPITAIDVAGDGRGLACLSEAVRSAEQDYHAEVSTWQVDTGAEQQRRSLNLSRTGETAVLPSIAFDQRGEFLAVTPSSGDLRLLATAEGQPLLSVSENALPPGARLVDESTWQLREEGEAVRLRDDPAALNQRAVRIAPGRNDFALRFYPKQVLDKQDTLYAAYARLRLESPNPYGPGCIALLATDKKTIFAQNQRGHDLADGNYHWCKIADLKSVPEEYFCSIATLPGGPAVWVDAFAYGPLERGGDIAFAADDNHVWGLNGNHVVWWQLSSLQLAGRFTDRVSASLFGSSWITGIEPFGDELLVATSDKHLKRLARASGNFVATIPLDQSPSALAIAPDQSWCAVGMLNRELRLLSLPDGEELERMDGHSDSVIALAISRDQSWLASVDTARHLLLWRRDRNGLRRFLSLTLPARARALRFSAAGEKFFLLLEGERAVRIWDLPRLQEQTSGLLTSIRRQVAAQPSRANVESIP